MNLYKPHNRKFYYFAIVVNNERGRGQKVVNTYANDKRVATEIMRKTQLLSESVEAGMPLTAELHKWIEQMNAKLRKRLVAIGLLDGQHDASLRSIEDHIEDYLRDCRTGGEDGAWLNIKRSQLNRAVRETKAKRLSDLNLDRVSTFLQELRQTAKARTYNQNRSTIITFLNWCETFDRLPSHRVNRIPRLNEDEDRKFTRRAATKDEIDKFLAKVPQQRLLTYMAALLTGLRRNELRQIEARDIDLAEGTLTVRAEVAKTKEKVVMPLHDELRGPLQARLTGLNPRDRVFPPPPRMKTVRADLKRAGIEYTDAQGRQLDFHALRVTFATRLLREGIPPSIARRLTRHKSVKTLEKYYDKLGLEDAEGAMKKLPGVDTNRSTPEAK